MLKMIKVNLVKESFIQQERRWSMGIQGGGDRNRIKEVFFFIVEDRNVNILIMIIKKFV